MSFEMNLEEMMEAGAHFGHQTKRWNPKMRPYIYGARSGIHIIDLQKTLPLAQEALEFIAGIVAKGKDLLFVGTKPQARNVIQEQAGRCNMFYVTDRWMGGTLTNYQTIKKSIDRLIDLETRREKKDFEGYKKKELLEVDRTIDKLESSLGGIKKLKGVPGVLFVVDPKQERIAIQEANKLGIPVVALTDSNCDPDPIDYIIPSNDDAISSIEYFSAKVADACLAGLEKRELLAQQTKSSEGDQKARAPKKRRTAKGTSSAKSYVSKAAKEQAFEGDASEGFSATTETSESPEAETKKKAEA